MRPRLLIDENLSPSLVEVAARRGYHAAHVRDVGLLQAKDWTILRFVLDKDWTLVTNNVAEFRARYRQTAPLHAGLVCLISVDLGRAVQRHAFSYALDGLDENPDLINKEMIVDGAFSPPRAFRRDLP